MTARQTQSTYRFLLFDGFSFYIEYDFVDFAQRHYIILFDLSSHITHFL